MARSGEAGAQRVRLQAYLIPGVPLARASRRARLARPSLKASNSARLAKRARLARLIASGIARLATRPASQLAFSQNGWLSKTN